jgi:Mrp family chromosome partitioning ATPase
MRRRRPKVPVLAEIPAAEGASQRPGALGRGALGAYSAFFAALHGSPVALLSGPAKTGVATGLAAAATAEGRRVALLECDLSSPALAGTLGLGSGPGFAEYLRGQVEATQILQPLVLAGPASGRASEPLTCIVAGHPDPAPSPLLLSERCAGAIERLARAYELLVVDGPSLADDPEAFAALARLAGTTALCVERNERPKRLPAAIDGLVVFG